MPIASASIISLLQPGGVGIKDFCKLIVFLLALLILCTPIHELGHFCLAYYYAKKKGYDVRLNVSYRSTDCSDWTVYSEKELIAILESGVRATLMFCMHFAILATFCSNSLLSLAFSLYAIIEVEFNCTIDSGKDTDYYYLKYPNRLSSENLKPACYRNLLFVLYAILLFAAMNAFILNHFV